MTQNAQKVLPARPQPKKAPQAYPRGYVEDAFEVRTPLAGCFSILLEQLVEGERNRRKRQDKHGKRNPSDNNPLSA